MEQLVTSDFRLGIIAGGQLGKMLALAASTWDVRTHVLDGDPHCPAASVCSKCVTGDPRDPDAVLRFGRTVDMVTLEIEDVHVDALDALKREGVRVYPDPALLAVLQDKGTQRMFYRDQGIPSPGFSLWDGAEDIRRAAEDGRLIPPFVQKLRRGGYDGRGVHIVHDSADLARLLEGPSVVEDLVDVHREIAVIVARNGRGETRCFPAVEMVFNPAAHLVERLVSPASLSDADRRAAEDVAQHIAQALDLRGILAVEMFLDTVGRLTVNEAAPRPHNSGHHTIESTITSQFEQHLRAIFNFPLGSTRVKTPAVMLNVLGEPGCAGAVRYEGLTECLALPGVKIHLYGKKETRPYRKMGHVTVLAPSLEEARHTADVVAHTLKVTAWPTPS